MERALVIGSTPGALRAAALLADRGITVRYLGLQGTPDGLAGGPPFGTGYACTPTTEDSAGLARVWGNLATVRDQAASMGLLYRDSVWSLPLSRADVFRVFPPQVAQGVVSGVAGSRLAQRVGSLTSLGREERTYAQWVQHRFGDVALEQLHAPYARKRFATSLDALSAPTAWRVHGRENHELPLVAPATGVEAARQLQRQRILDNGGEILEGVQIEGFEVADGRVSAVMTDSGREHVDSLVFTDATPHTVMGWCPEEAIDRNWARDLSMLDYAHAVQVTVPASSELPQQLHVADADRPFWKLSRFGLLPGESRWVDTITAHLTLRDDDPLWRGDDAALVDVVKRSLGGLAEVGTGEVFVQRQPEAVLRVGHITQTAVIRRLEQYDLIGVVGVGGRGCMRLADVVDEQALVDGVLSTEVPKKRAAYQRDPHRFIFEQPVRLPPHARLTPFVSR